MIGKRCASPVSFGELTFLGGHTSRRERKIVIKRILILLEKEKLAGNYGTILKNKLAGPILLLLLYYQ